jgi:hypothetical protein
MTKRIPALLMALAFALALGSAREAYAVPGCSECQSMCQYDCFLNGTTCFQFSASCDGGGGWCDWTCTGNGGSGYSACSCPSGSPIFRKRPVRELSSMRSEAQVSRYVPAAAPSRKTALDRRALLCP